MTDTILIERLEGNYGDIGRIQLNAPKSLNALSLDIVSVLYKQLMKWQNDKNIAGVWIDSTSEKAFCAGGDVVGIYKDQSNHQQPETPDLAKKFFEAEYKNNLLIHHYKKPVVFWGQGLVLGGGVGLMANGQFRIATQASRFAWPEVKIGLFPDVGGGFYLGRLPKHLAYLMGIGGTMVNSEEAKLLGLVDHCIDANAKDKVLALFCEHLDDEAFELALESMERDTESPASRIDETALTDLFKDDNLPAIQHRISELPSEVIDRNSLLKELQNNVNYGCPLSAKVFMEQYQRCQMLDYDEVIDIEYKMACAMTAMPDFYEGVRALLVDKDNQPSWAYDWNNIVDVDVTAIFENAFNMG